MITLKKFRKLVKSIKDLSTKCSCGVTYAGEFCPWCGKPNKN